METKQSIGTHRGAAHDLGVGRTSEAIRFKANSGARALVRKERRRYMRHAANLVMEIRGHIRGSQQIDELKGVTMDVSCGGARAVFRDRITPDPETTFLVRFVDAAGAVVAPEFRWGTVTRAEAGPDESPADCVVAVKFKEPLPSAVLHRLLSAAPVPARRALAH